MTENTALTPVALLRTNLNGMKKEFASVLPKQIDVDRFIRTTITAVQMDSNLLIADRKSLMAATMKAAQDGLMCDGREAALTIFNKKVKDQSGERWEKQVQYMPMVAGLLKKIRNSGEVSSIGANIVYKNDKFRYWVDNTGEHIEHEPLLDGERGEVHLVYAFAVLRDGMLQVEVMNKADIEKVRAVSRSKDSGPWASWWEEMAKKTAVRRLSKKLPSSTDLEQIVKSDNETYELDKETEEALEYVTTPPDNDLASKMLTGMDTIIPQS